MKIRRIIKIIAWVTLWLTFFSYVETFYRAYFFGNYTAIVHINDYGEAFPEFIWITLSIPCVLYLFIDKLWNLKFFKEIRERKMKKKSKK